MRSQYVGIFNDSGTANSFYTLEGRKYGFKSFPDKELAKFSFAVQSELAQHTLAPKVYGVVGRIRIEQAVWTGYDKKGFNIFKNQMILSDWGYLTEIAKPYTCPHYYSECDEHCAFSGCCRNSDRINELLDCIQECGIEYTDAHNGNLGVVRRGNKRHIVVIDLGRESIGGYDENKYPYVGYYNSCDCSDCRRYNYV